MSSEKSNVCNNFTFKIVSPDSLVDRLTTNKGLSAPQKCSGIDLNEGWYKTHKCGLTQNVLNDAMNKAGHNPAIATQFTRPYHILWLMGG